MQRNAQTNYAAEKIPAAPEVVVKPDSAQSVENPAVVAPIPAAQAPASGKISGTFDDGRLNGIRYFFTTHRNRPSTKFKKIRNQALMDAITSNYITLNKQPEELSFFKDTIERDKLVVGGIKKFGLNEQESKSLVNEYNNIEGGNALSNFFNQNKKPNSEKSNTSTKRKKQLIRLKTIELLAKQLKQLSQALPEDKRKENYFNTASKIFDAYSQIFCIISIIKGIGTISSKDTTSTPVEVDTVGESYNLKLDDQGGVELTIKIPSITLKEGQKTIAELPVDIEATHHFYKEDNSGKLGFNIAKITTANAKFVNDMLHDRIDNQNIKVYAGINSNETLEEKANRLLVQCNFTNISLNSFKKNIDTINTIKNESRRNRNLGELCTFFDNVIEIKDLIQKSQLSESTKTNLQELVGSLINDYPYDENRHSAFATLLDAIRSTVNGGTDLNIALQGFKDKIQSEITEASDSYKLLVQIKASNSQEIQVENVNKGKEKEIIIEEEVPARKKLSPEASDFSVATQTLTIMHNARSDAKKTEEINRNTERDAYVTYITTLKDQMHLLPTLTRELDFLATEPNAETTKQRHEDFTKYVVARQDLDTAIANADGKKEVHTQMAQCFDGMVSRDDVLVHLPTATNMVSSYSDYVGQTDDTIKNKKLSEFGNHLKAFGDKHGIDSHWVTAGAVLFTTLVAASAVALAVSTGGVAIPFIAIASTPLISALGGATLATAAMTALAAVSAVSTAAIVKFGFFRKNDAVNTQKKAADEFKAEANPIKEKLARPKA